MQQRPYTVVVGVSAAPQSSAARRWAAEQVAQRGGRLVVLRVLRVSGPQATPAPTGAGRVRTAHDAVEQDRALLEAAEQADLLVIDTPRATATSPLLAQRLVRTTRCPVVVVPLGASDRASD